MDSQRRDVLFLQGCFSGKKKTNFLKNDQENIILSNTVVNDLTSGDFWIMLPLFGEDTVGFSIALCTYIDFLKLASPFKKPPDEGTQIGRGTK